MPQFNDQSRSHTAFKQDSTLIAVLEMSQSAWLVAGLVPGIERHPLEKIEADEATLLTPGSLPPVMAIAGVRVVQPGINGDGGGWPSRPNPPRRSASAPTCLHLRAG